MATRNRQPLETVVMSGGAPQSPLMAGFLHAMWEKKKTFRNFHTSGAGALMALLFISPKGTDPGTALRKWVEAGVADEIYRVIPQNFKLFRKPGPFSPAFHRLAERFKIPVESDAAPADGKDPVTRLLAELLAGLEGYKLKGGPHGSQTDPIEKFRDVWSSLWLGDANSAVRSQLLDRLDPIRRLRNRWLTSLLQTPEHRRLYNDMIDLWFSAITPSTLTSRSLGLAAPLPFLEDIVDFRNLDAQVKKLVNDPKKPAGHLCVNAYNMTADAKTKASRAKKARAELHQLHVRAAGMQNRAKAHHLLREGMKAIRKEELEEVMEFFVSPFQRRRPDEDHPITADGIRAAFSMPFIYPPAQIEGHYYSEGADHEPINFRHAETRGELPIVLLDVLGGLEDFLVRRPRDLWDAYVISIMTPVVALAKMGVSEFIEDHKPHNLIAVEWEIPSEAQPYVMDWSYSNLSTLFEVGRKAGLKFIANNSRRLLSRGQI